ncbi:sporulation integral membrane protein YtvI [Anaerosacchariphilus polymeriproducens]|uniref:Sporulation integral membrane protein YtvI n=1 Tax=Anaerosacchariphilus polymeriproducens TaxID=1812858 RepID=A0A371AUV5_9FIRM|nr:sporulation integral membrane protein YtvI [Anaerosacchariphilus polymeriproducens]RDU23331.1 sporulation integral membrane protein YtvI [Anaerosacchariphilus polymeriproducens]
MKYLKILINILLPILVILVCILIIPKLITLFMPFVIGWIISLIANPLVRWLESKVKIVRKHSSVIIIVLVIGFIVFLGYATVSKVMYEGEKLIGNAPQIYSELEKQFYDTADNFEGVYQKLPKNMQKQISDSGRELSNELGDFVKSLGAPTVEAAGDFARNIPSTLIAIIVTFLSSYFFIAQREQILGFWRKHMPKSFQEKMSIINNSLKEVVGGYFKAQLKIMVVVAIILLVGLLILNVNYVVILALLIAFLDMLPFFGTGTVLVPWAVLELLSSDYKMAVGLLILYGVTQLVRQLIQPKVLGDSIGLNPMLALIFIYGGYKFSGVLGMLLAVPAAMIVIRLYEAGLFDFTIRNIKELISDLNKFRKI